MSINSKNILPEQHLKLYNTCFKIAFLVILFLGLSLRFYFYFINRDLGADEAHLALNFIHLGYIGLTQPLENFQSAPIFFLWSVETITRFFGFNELSLRLIPFIFSILSFPLFYFFVRDLTKSRLIALIAFLLFAFNYSIIYFSTEMKPYTIDVSAFVVIGFLLFSNVPFVSKRRMTLLALSGCILLLFSISTVIILFCASIIMIGNWYHQQKLRNRKEKINYTKSVIYVFVSWGIVFLTNFFIFIFKHPYSEGMKNIWSWAFCPTNILSTEFAKFIEVRLEDTLFSNMLLFDKSYYFPYLLLVITIVSIISLGVHKKFNVIVFSVFIILIHLGLSMMQLYPFYHRFILYLLPPFFILFSYGLVIILKIIGAKTHWILSCVVLCVFIFETNVASAKKYFLVDKEREILPVLNFIDKHYPNTEILVATPFTLYCYYSETGRVKNKNFKPIEWALKPEDFRNHKLIIPQLKNYVFLYSIGDDFDGFGETLRDLKNNKQIVKQYDYSIFGLSEIKPQGQSNQTKLVQSIDFQYFKNMNPSNQDSKSFIPLWNNNPITFSLGLEKGNYQLLFTAKGDALKSIYPHLLVNLNNHTVAEMDINNKIERYYVDFKIDTFSNSNFSISMNNDESAGNEDRNAFIQNIFIFKTNTTNENN